MKKRVKKWRPITISLFSSFRLRSQWRKGEEKGRRDQQTDKRGRDTGNEAEKSGRRGRHTHTQGQGHLLQFQPSPLIKQAEEEAIVNFLEIKRVRWLVKPAAKGVERIKGSRHPYKTQMFLVAPPPWSGRCEVWEYNGREPAVGSLNDQRKAIIT